MPAVPESLDAPLPDHCLSCAAPLHAAGGVGPRFCPACGQETTLRAPTLLEFAQQFGGAYLSTEGALWRTLKLLVRRPGELTRQYLAGRRKHYVLPLRLYLTVSVLVLLALRWQAELKLEALGGTATTTPPTLQFSMLGGRAGLRDGQFACHDLPAWVCARLKRRFDKEPSLVAGNLATVGERIVANLGGAMFVAVPAFALLTWVSWWRRQLRYTEHLVFALHLHVFWFLMLGLTLLPAGAWLEVPALLAVPVYTLLALRQVMGGGWPGLLLRAATVAVAYGAVLALTVSLLALVVLLF